MKLKIAFFALILMATSSVAGPVSHFGSLKTCTSGSKGRICGSLTGSTPIMLKGPSLFWSSGLGNSFYRREVLDWFVDNMEIGITRAAMAIKYNGDNTGPISTSDGGTCGSCFGYLSTQPSGGQVNYKESKKSLIKKAINAAIDNDIYIIVDWHSHNASSSTERNEAVTFFREFAEEYKDVPHVIWEIYNEPVNDDANTIKDYANPVIKAIRDAGNTNLIILGSNFYSQNPKQQADAGITDSGNNTAYSFHFYSNEHGYNANSGIGGSTNNAIDAGFSVFATEWGSVSASGAGGTGGYDNWITFMDNNDISGCYWNASNINENNQTSRIFNVSIDDLIKSTSVSNVLTPSGTVFQTYMGTKKWSSYSPATTNPKGKDISTQISEGTSKIWSATDLGLTSGATIKSAEVLDGGGTVEHTSNSITYQSADNGSLALSQGKTIAQAYIIYYVTNGTKDIKQRIVVNIKDLKPVLPKQEPLNVSRKATTIIRMPNLSASDPNGGNGSTLSFDGVSVISGPDGATITFTKDTIKFTPPASISNEELTVFELEYAVKTSAGPGVSKQSITLNARNFAPTVSSAKPGERGTLYTSTPNTGPLVMPATKLGSDRDLDSLTIVAYYIDPAYPGTLEKNESGDALIYTPEPGKKGTVRFLVAVSDGISESNVGGYRITLTGDGSDIEDIDFPSEIPGYSPILKPVYAGSGISLMALGNGKLLANFAKGGKVSLSVYSLSGKLVGNLVQGHQNAGSHEFSLGNLQKGVYIVRLKQGSEVKILKMVR